MLIYVYDGSFEGLLTAIYEAYYRRQNPDAVLQEQGLQQDITARYVSIETDPSKSDRVYESIWRKISTDALKNVYYTFLSEDPGYGTLIYKYLQLGWKMGSKVDLALTDDAVFKIMDICRRVEHEIHRLMGFIRFRQVDGGIYYSSVSPDHNVVELLAPHFAERLPDQKWIIHDVKREIAALFNSGKWIITEFTAEDIPADSAEEKQYKQLWKDFFNTLAIPERNNPKLQRRLMPRRYWEHLPEKW